MIRTRDFILYMVCIGFLLLLVGGTLVQNQSSDTSEGSTDAVLTALPPATWTAEVVPETTAPDRLALMREKIKNDDSVLRSAVIPIETEIEATTTPEEVVAETVLAQYCSFAVAHEAALGWPAQPFVDLTAEARTVSYSRMTTEATASTSAVFTEIVWQTLPARSIRSNFDTCLPDTTIGITIDGLPLDNKSAANYAGAGPNTLLGYSRDGFPVLGALADETVLDECGGYYAPAGYQYHVRVGESDVIRCYAGVPVDLTITQ